MLGDCVKRVCHLTSVHDSLDGRIFYKECVSLSEAGYEVHLVAPGESRTDRNVIVHGVGASAGNRVNRMTVMVKKVIMEALALNADIYHIHDPELLPHINKLKRQNAYIIYDMHEDYIFDIRNKTWIPRLLRPLVAFSFEFYLRKRCKKLDGVISVNEKLCAYLRSLNPNVALVSNYPIISEQDRVEPVYTKNWAIGFAGGITNHWMHETVLEALEKLDGAKYLLCGDGSENYLNILKAMSSWQKVDYQGRIPLQEVQPLLRACAIGLTLANPKNDPDDDALLSTTKIYEVMLAGIPLLCTNFTAWERLVDENQCGMTVDPNDKQAVFDAIQYLLGHPEESEIMGKNGRRAVLDKYNWNGEAKKLLSLYSIIRESQQ